MMKPARPDAVLVVSTVVACLCACIWGDARAEDVGVPPLLDIAGSGISFPGTPVDSLAGRTAAWLPSYEAILATTGDNDSTLVRYPWPAAGKNPRPRPLPLPPPMEEQRGIWWQWSPSPDGRWIAVVRTVRVLAPNATCGVGEEVTDWLGFVDLKEERAIPLPVLQPPWPSRVLVLGWRGGSALFELGESTITAIDPRAPGKWVRFPLPEYESVAQVAPDGHHVVSYDGREGNVVVSLRELGGERHRVLWRKKRLGSYGSGDGAAAAFSPDSTWLAVSRRDCEDRARCTSTLRVESLDGVMTRFESTFESDETRIPAGPTWRPDGTRLAWEAEGCIVISTLHGAMVEVPLKVGLQHYPRALVWSPDGKAIAWGAVDGSVWTVAATGGSPTLVEPGQQTARSRVLSWAAPLRVGR